MSDSKKPATVIYDPEYYKLKEKFINDNYEIKQFISLKQKHAGTVFNGKQVALISQIEIINGKVIIAIPFNYGITNLFKFLLMKGVEKDDIVITFNKPNYIPDEQAVWMPESVVKHAIMPDGNFVCEIEGRKLLTSSYNELLIVKEVFYTKCYDFFTPHTPVTIIDIGMNIGIASLFFLMKEGVSAIYSFEPFPATFERALENFNLNQMPENKLFPHSYGISNITKNLSVPYDEKIKGHMSTAFINESPSDIEKITVQIVDVNEVFAAIIKRHPDDRFIFKIDCEGGEYDIFDRLNETGLINKIHLFIVEWHNLSNKNVSHIESILMQNNFIYQIIGSRHRSPGMIFATNGQNSA